MVKKDMVTQTVRVFLGNLPPAITENDIVRKVKKYANVTSVELKQRDNGAFAFVDIEDSETNLDNCFEKLSSKSWKGFQLRVQRAKESFLERLSKERKENEILADNKKNVGSSQNVSHSGRSEVIIHKSIRSNNFYTNRSEDQVETYEKPNDSSISKKGLCMFKGTGAIFRNCVKEDVLHNPISSVSGDLLKSKLQEEERILHKFESSDSVWKDSYTSDDEYIPSSKHSKIVPDLNTSSNYARVEDPSSDVSFCNNSSISRATYGKKLHISGDKNEEAEIRRLKAVGNRQKELLKRKEAVKLALSSVDMRTNKKIVFDDDDLEEAQKNMQFSSVNNNNKNNEGKLLLFNDDEMDHDEEYDNDFRVRSQFQGKKGQKLFKLQARYGNDQRFTLDERFIESDEDKDEQEEVFGLSSKALGIDVKGSDKTKTKLIAKPMLRYDPMKPDHTKFEVKGNSDVRLKKKAKQSVESDVSSTDGKIAKVPHKCKVHEETLPVVSKERFYEVTDTLRESLQNKGQTFSMLEILGKEEEKKDIDQPSNMTPIANKKWSLDKFRNKSSSEEDDGDEVEEHTNSLARDESQYIQNNYGVKQEDFFFELNDPRFLEGMMFFQNKNHQFIEEFGERRKIMKDIVRSKIAKKLVREEKRNTIWGRMKRNSMARSSR